MTTDDVNLWKTHTYSLSVVITTIVHNYVFVNEVNYGNIVKDIKNFFNFSL